MYKLGEEVLGPLYTGVPLAGICFVGFGISEFGNGRLKWCWGGVFIFGIRTEFDLGFDMGKLKIINGKYLKLGYKRPYNFPFEE